MKLGRASRGPEEDPPAVGPTFIAVATMLGTLYFIGHQLACLWFGVLDESKDVNWLNRYGGEVNFADTLTLFEQYVISLYWAFTTMTTVSNASLSLQEYRRTKTHDFLFAHKWFRTYGINPYVLSV